MTAELDRIAATGSGAHVDVGGRWGPGDVARLRDLYEPLRRFAAVVGSWDVDPDDLVQGAYARVLRKEPAEIRELGPYLRRTIANLATDERRRATRARRALRAVGPGDPAADAYPSDLEDLLRLDGRTRALLYLVEVEGSPVADAARAVDMSNGAARVALMRARRRLRTELTTEASGE